MTVTVGPAPVGDRLQVLSKSWLPNRFRSFPVLLPYQQIPCGRDHRWLTAK